MGPTSAGIRRPPLLLCLLIFALYFASSPALITQRLTARLSIVPSSSPTDLPQGTSRHRRASTESLLTVEWEGIQSGDHPDSSIRGFIVEYRAEKEQQWNVHSGVIPYKGPNHQYRVQIPKLPTGISYFVRIKVLGEKGEVLVETPEIRARNEIVSIKCEPDEITAPGDLDIKERGQFSVALAWQPPECGSIGEYQLELRGLGEQQFDVHRQTVAQPQASITGLLSGTEYGVRIRAVDRARIVGPWTEELITVSTKGDLPEEGEAAQLEYASEAEARISWPPMEDARLQHYEVVLTEMDGHMEEGKPERVDRSRQGPAQKTSVHFGELKPDREYKVGILAYVDHEPKRLHRLSFRTGPEPAIELAQKPVVIPGEDGAEYEVHWKSQPELGQVDRFIVEYRPGNETKWHQLASQPAGQQQSHWVKGGDELRDAFSVRVLFVESGAKKEVARTAEGLVKHRASGNSCERVAPGEPSGEGKGPDAVQFSWERIECEGRMEGWEYAIWPSEDGEPPETTSFSDRPQVTVRELEPSREYRFRVRHRLLHGHGPWSPTAIGKTGAPAPEEGEGVEPVENIYRLRVALAPPRSFLVWTPLPEHRRRIQRFKVSHKPTSQPSEWTSVEGPPDQFACPPGLGQAGIDFCLDLQGLDMGHQYSAEVVYKVDGGPAGKWSRKGSPLFFILVQDESKEGEAEEGQQQQLKFGEIRVEQLDGAKTAVHWKTEGRDADQVRAYQVEVRAGPEQAWRPASGYVGPERHDQREFRAELDSALLAGQAEIRIRAVGADGKPVALSQPLDSGTPCEPLSQPPREVSLRRVDTGLLLRWSFPSPADPSAVDQCQLHFLVGGILNGASFQRAVDGRARELRLADGANGSGQVRLSVHAVNRLGAGPASVPVTIGEAAAGDRLQPKTDGTTTTTITHTRQRRSVALHHHQKRTTRMRTKRTGRICDPRTDFWCRPDSFSVDDVDGPRRRVLVSTPTVSTTPSGSLEVQWRSQGNGRGVFGYRVLYRPLGGGGWNTYGQLVPYVGEDEDYSQHLEGLSLGTPYEIQIQALDRNAYVLFTSPDVRSSANCLTPVQPPDQLAVDAPDPRHVRVTWVPVAKSAWRCAQAQVELQIDEPRGHSPSPVTVDAQSSSHVFDSASGQRWTIRARVRNEAGSSPWSAAVSVSTLSSAQSLAEPLDGPFVSFTHGVPRLSWRGREGADPELVDHFVVEWRRRTEPAWRDTGEKVPFAGWQRPYSADLGQLGGGHVYEVRVRAVDHNMGTAFLSGTITVQPQAQCQPPRSAPRSVQITPLGPNQLRLGWLPLVQSEWNCDQLWYVVKYSSAEQQGFRNLSAADNSAIFDSAPFTQWHFQVQAANPAGAGPWSAAQGGQTLATAPGPVAEFAAQPLAPDAVQLSWRPPQIPNGQITGYEVTYQLVSRGMCPNGPAAAAAGDGTPTTVVAERPSYTLQQLHPHSRYRIGIAARTESGAGERVTREVQTDQSAPTAPPANFRVDNVGEQSAELSWHAPPCVHTNGDITEYEYEIAAADRLSAQIPRLTDVTRSTRVHLTGLLPATSYTARVRAFTARGAGPWSSELRFQTRPAALRDQPQPRVFATGPREAQLVWQTGQGQANYWDKFACSWAPAGTPQYQEERVFPAYNPCEMATIQRYKLPPTTTQVQTHCGPIQMREDPAIFDYKVRAKPRDEPWPQWSAPQRPVVLQPQPPPRPPPPRPMPVLIDECVTLMGLQKQGGSPNALRFGWSVRPSDMLRCTAFVVSVTPRDLREPARQFRVDGSTSQYLVDGLRPATVYTVHVQPVVNDRPCTGISVDMATDPEPLIQLQRPRIVEERATSITIAWDVPASVQCSSFMVEYRVESGPWMQQQQRVPCQPGRATYTATVPGLPTNSAVDLRVRVISMQNQPSNPSPEVRGHTKCSPPDSPPHGLRLDSPSQNEVRLSWARLAKSSWNCDELNIDIGYRTGDQPERVITVPGDKVEHIFASEPNTRWTVRLRATNQAGSSPWGPEQSLTTRQGAPGHVLNLQLTPLSPNEIRVRWSPPAVQRGTIVGYDISYRLKHRLACPEEEPRDVSRDFVTIYNYKDTEYTLTGLLPNSLYEVKVRARTTELGPEETREGATLQQPPSAPPLNLQLTYALERSLSFQWEPVECSQRHGTILAYEYEIIGQDDWAKLERQIANTSQTRVTIDGLTPYTKYVFRVRAYNGVGGGPATENLDVMTAKANAPLPPQDLVVTQEGVSWFTVSWLPPYPPYGPHDRYKLQYQLFSASPNDWRTIEVDARSNELECPVPGPRLCYNITNLDQGQQYRVKVAAHIEGGTYGPFSNIVIANTLRVLPGAPASIQLIAKTDHSLHVGWRPPLDPHQQITQYRLSWQSLAQPNAQRFSKLVDHPTLDYLIEGLEPETMYNISLSAGTPHGFGPEIWAQFKTDPFKVPSVLQAPIVTPEGAHILHVEWIGVVDTQNRVAGYIVEIRTSDAPQWTEATGVVRHEPGRRTYRTKLDGLEPDTLYFVRIKVVDHNQRISEPSPEAHARTGCAPPTSPPTGLGLHSTDWRQVRVTWQPPAKQSWLCSSISYELEYRNGSQPARVMEIPSHLNDHSLPSGPSTEWIVRMRTKNPAGESPWSPPVTLSTKGGPPGAVTDLRAEPTSPTTVLATWTPPESDDEITGYTLVYNLRSIGECGPSSAKPITKHSHEPRLELDGLLPDSTYDIYVHANTAHQQGPKSEVVTVRTEESVPTGQPNKVRVASVTATRAELLWNEIECELRHGKITGYDYELDDLSGEGANRSQQSTTHRVSLDDLTPYTEYRARVRGRNSKGEGPFSDYVTFRTLPAAPPPPTDLREEEQLAHALEISFLPPHPPNGILDQYRIRWTVHGKYSYQEKRVPAFQLECSNPKLRGRLCYRVTGLEPEQEYLIQAAAHTEHGDWSEWSEPLITQTVPQEIPVLETPLELDFVKSTSIGVRWHGLDEQQAEHIVGYVLEYKSENDADWTEWNGVVRHRHRQPDYRAVVKGLTESTEYFFRLRVVGKNDKRGGPGPELKAITKCGKPEQPPSNVRIEAVDFQQVRILWEPPEEETWKCDQVEFALHYSNSSGQQKAITFPPDGPREVILDSMPGTRWEAKMRTQTVEPGEEPKQSGWSNRAVLVTKSLPDQISLVVTPKGPTQGEAIWDLPEGYQDWPWGVDLSYRLVRLGGCKKFDKAMGEPVVMENVQDKQVLLDNLYPGSEYEVTVTLRQPPGFDRRIPPKKAVQRFQTEDQPPTGAPTKLRVEGRWDTKLAFGWEPPECLEQNGEISQYEYELTGQEEWNQGTREGVSPRQRADIGDLMPGSLYRFRVRAFTSAGPGPWSEPIDARTTGSEIGPPRDLTAVDTFDTSIQLAWLPPHPETSPIVAYRLKYGPSSDSTRSQEIVLHGDELSCSGYQSSILTADHLCTTVTGLKPSSTYRFAVQAQAASGNWGPFTVDYFATTRPEFREMEGGSLRLLSAGHDNLRVKWTPPGVVGANIDAYEVFIAVATTLDQSPRHYETPGSQTDYHFKGLEPVTLYNVTVRGLQGGKSLWFISGNFPTTDVRETLLDWLGMGCTEVRLIEKSESMLHVTWTPPDIFEPEYRDLHTHYRVTIAPVDGYTMRMGQRKNYTVMVPGNSIRFTDLQPETTYNITVQGGTDVGYGQMAWGIWQTLPMGKTWILRLRSKTPNTLTVEWDPVWGFAHSGYMLTAKTIHSASGHARLNAIKSFDVSPTATEYTIRGLDPTSTYNVTLSLKDQADGAWGVYSTMLPGCNLPGNLNHCDQTRYATSMSWEPVENNAATHYQVRYIHLHSTRTLWVEEPERHRKYLLCPKDPCNRLCYLVFNLAQHPEEYAFMVRAKVDGIWNNWKLAGRPTIADPPEVKENCCIVPPPYHVEHIGSPGTTWEVPVAPSPTQKNITRYYVVVDERDPPGDTNWTQLTDKVTANRLHIPYYVTGSFSTETLDMPTRVRIGDGQVIGGYLNYPLQKGKTYNYEIYTKWMMHGDQPVIARLRAAPFLSAGWPWWWLLLLLLLLLLCILLTCLLLWLLQRRRRRRYVNGQHERLIKEERYEHKRGDFEDGYSRGYRAGRGGTRMEEDYRGRDDAFREGYAKGLRDAGERGMSTSMSNLAQRPTQRLGYSSGYMQGMRDGNSGVFGDRISESLLKRLEEQYPDNEEFRAGYIDGFKDGVGGGRRFEDSRRIQQSLTELTERLTTIEKTVEKGGDELHSTKIYHVYNQSPEMVAQGQQLVSELEELASGSRRSTLRRHYTPGDYLKYEEGGAGLAEYNSLGRSRRSMSASALGRGEAAALLDQRQRHHSGASFEGHHLEGGGGVVHESYSRSATRQSTSAAAGQGQQYRSELGSPPRRYASQTLLDGARPGPTTPHHARRTDALQELQRELDSLASRSPAGGGERQREGSVQHHQAGRSYEYATDTFQSSASEREQQHKVGAKSADSKQQEATTVPITTTSGTSGTQQSQHHIKESAPVATTTHQWPEDLMEIVHEPMGQTLDRMRRFSTSLSNVERGESAAAAAESEKVDHQEKYKRTYREEYSGGDRR